jgi:hypothetical protein
MATTTEMRTGTCTQHGTVEAERQLPKLTFPVLVTGTMRYFAKRKPFRCPECGAVVTYASTPGPRRQSPSASGDA